MNDASLADSTPAADTPGAAGVFGPPTPMPEQPPADRHIWTVEEILAEAKLPEKHARVCLRADLEAEHHRILGELGGLVNAQGEVLGDPERSVGETSAADRARQLVDRLEVIRHQMSEAMWYPLFRGLSSEALQEFNAKHYPKKPDKNGDINLSGYNVLLIAETAIEPRLTPDQVQALRGKLGAAAYKQLVDTAQSVCVRGGVDVPKSPASLLNLAQN